MTTAAQPAEPSSYGGSATHGCPFCQSPTDREWAVVDGHRALQCAACEVVFFPRPIAVSAHYDDYYPYLADFDAARFAWELDIRRRKYRYQLQRVRGYMPGARRLADIGAGPGYFCKIASENGFDAVGVETSRPAIAAGERQFGVRYIGFENLPPASQDVITCHHVIEHLEEPARFLERVRERLVPGGLLVVHVPHREPLTFEARTRLARLRDPAAARRCQLYYPEHITGLCPRSLRRAVERFGFSCLELRSVSMWSRHYDPFFLRNYFRGTTAQSAFRADWSRLARHTLRCAADNVGNFVGRGDWLVAHFRAI